MVENAHITECGPVPAAVNVVVGHYGTGKTNFSLNWAFDMAHQGKSVTLVDFDVVNPYFRSSDYLEELEAAGIFVIAPNLAGSTLDNPSISGSVGTAIADVRTQWEKGDYSSAIVIDVGGDDAGATVLGRFAAEIAAGSYQMLYVVNQYRNLTRTSDEACAIMNEIQVKSGLRVTGIVNNSHLRDQTDVETVRAALEFGRSCARKAYVDLACTTVPEMPREQINQLFCHDNPGMTFYPVKMLVRTPWE